MAKKIKTKENEIAFSKELIKFYKEMIEGPIASIRTLAEIEEKFPEEYKLFKGLKDNPLSVNGFIEKAPQEVKDTLILIMYNSSTLGAKISELFKLSPAEKKQLAVDLENFGEDVESRLNKLIEYGNK